MAVSSELNAVSAASRLFTAALHGALRSHEGNLFYSPYSITAALALVHAGAEGQTRRELEEALGLDGAGEDIHRGFSRLARELLNRRIPVKTMASEARRKHSGDRPGTVEENTPRSNAAGYGFQLNTACNLWVQKGFPFNRAYLDLLAEIYDLAPGKLDFVGAVDAACRAINGWANEKTEGLIPEIVTAQNLGPLTRLVLANAVYFKAAWAEAFPYDQTTTEDFHCQDGGKTTVAMMHRQAWLAYWESDALQAITLPYVRPELQFTVLLPRPGHFDSVERQLDTELLGQVLFPEPGQKLVLFAESRHKLVRLGLPRFKLECDLPLKEYLEGLGLRRMFVLDADLSPMSSDPELHFSEVFHKAHIAVDESGTEAAAVTAAVALVFTGSAQEPEPIVMTADRPFLFFITDQPTQTVLFAGRMLRP